MEAAHLIVGLGNPGAKYEGTRHNAGFQAVEHLAAQWGAGWADEKKKFSARLARAEVAGRTVLLCEPLTFMNLSGEAVGAICDFYKIDEPARVLAIVDDANIEFGELRLRPGGSAGGHNGLRSIEQHLATPEYPRLRIGVGRPADDRQELASHVLGKFGEREAEALKPVLEKVTEQVNCWLAHGPQRAMNEFNGKVFPPATDDTDKKEETET
jgi:PTH1 family peptidyl-tRNA hydrolase